jgi:hypothetical protein
VGDEIETYVHARQRRSEGVVNLSKKRLDTVKAGMTSRPLRESNPCRGGVTRTTRAGRRSSCGAARVSVPASQTGRSP